MIRSNSQKKIKTEKWKAILQEFQCEWELKYPEGALQGNSSMRVLATKMTASQVLIPLANHAGALIHLACFFNTWLCTQGDVPTGWMYCRLGKVLFTRPIKWMCYSKFQLLNFTLTWKEWMTWEYAIQQINNIVVVNKNRTIIISSDIWHM